MGEVLLWFGRQYCGAAIFMAEIAARAFGTPNMLYLERYQNSNYWFVDVLILLISCFSDA
jgi:hypothetical protein